MSQTLLLTKDMLGHFCKYTFFVTAQTREVKGQERFTDKAIKFQLKVQKNFILTWYFEILRPKNRKFPACRAINILWFLVPSGWNWTSRVSLSVTCISFNCQAPFFRGSNKCGLNRRFSFSLCTTLTYFWISSWNVIRFPLLNLCHKGYEIFRNLATNFSFTVHRL